MGSYAPVFSLLIVLTTAAIIMRVASIALEHTGLSREAARFQARSAFMGVGYTTLEAEQLVNHPVRRRVLMILMLVGPAGFVTVVSTTMVAVIKVSDSPKLTSFLLGLGGLLTLIFVSRSQRVERHMARIISWALRTYTRVDSHDYVGLLRLSGEYSVHELLVEKGDWLAERPLQELKLRDEGVMVLGITRKDGKYVGAPRGSTKIHVGDNLIIYGKGNMCANLAERRVGVEGEVLHRQAVSEQTRNLLEQEREEATVDA